ncbi:hypothetical protein PICMEDRAFT_131882 [Pichia membranifaciens NRRL Y-2026]|uniref:Uncharacterized protein n=1 Tax=Pichia membranifaciens NRRL Y-2026 TaxID=763406 RepID=A0A1E3NKB8_9ASCO|nr:hypothetical protein PICMEDRAFT_131882 [Pichia membranifaciens NRRL Y-2026]ODQ46561.1 hypothetical protein PICMEDRAFT_131882 [Pichia membranifaciens NRRL Y-2026]
MRCTAVLCCAVGKRHDAVLLVCKRRVGRTGSARCTHQKITRAETREECRKKHRKMRHQTR